MNTNLIRKCLDELEKEAPSIPYLKGILESIMELSGTPTERIKSRDEQVKELLDNGFKTNYVGTETKPEPKPETEEERIARLYNSGTEIK